MIAETVARYPGFFERLSTIITPQRTFATFKAISDVRAPTLMARHTRGRAIARMIGDAQRAGACAPRLSYSGNLHGSGAAALSLGTAVRKPIWCFAHIDNISFLTGALGPQGYALTPFCEAKQSDGRRAAQALDYSAETHSLKTVARGWLVTHNGTHVFATDARDLPPATRVVYASEAEWDRASGMVHGCIDDAAGAAALMLAALALSVYDIDALFVLTDEEEGPVAPGPQAFARCSARLFHRAPRESLPELVTVTDTHDVGVDASGALRNERFGTGACFAAFGSHARGAVTPPPLLAFQRALARELAGHGVTLVENTSYVGRSDDASAILATPNVALIGCPGAYAHFAQRPRLHIADLVNLAKTLAVTCLVAQDAAWRERVLA
jgi:Peptidase family M20/M25/M40